MFSASSAEVETARRLVTSLVTSEVLRRQADIERFLIEHIDPNNRIPKVVRSHLRRLAACESDEDKFYFELIDELWASCSKVESVRWTNINGGRLVVGYSDREERGFPLFWSANHFKVHHAKAVAKISAPGREALDMILDSPGVWESIGLVRNVTEEGLRINFELPHTTQSFVRPLSPNEFFKRFDDAINSMSFMAQSLLYSALLSHGDIESNLDDIQELSEDRRDHFIKIKRLAPEGFRNEYLFQDQSLDEFTSRFQQQLTELPERIGVQLIKHMQSAAGPWFEAGNVSELLLTHMNTVEMSLLSGGTYRFHPIMPVVEFIESVLPELTSDKGLRQVVIGALNQNAQAWCRYGYVEKLSRHIGGAVELVSEDRLSWYLFEPQTTGQFLDRCARGRKDLSERAMRYIEEFAQQHPEYFNKFGLVWSVEEDRETDQVVFQTLITNCETIRLPIF